MALSPRSLISFKARFGRISGPLALLAMQYERTFAEFGYQLPLGWGLILMIWLVWGSKQQYRLISEGEAFRVPPGQQGMWSAITVLAQAISGIALIMLLGPKVGLTGHQMWSLSFLVAATPAIFMISWLRWRELDPVSDARESDGERNSLPSQQE